ncbi:hypothetical protein BDQ12DRAFT_677736 [Crucibulum laeve]|uniref:F-box domain-containing protein n=1 Tax=Crucibulum laeve TaxID=68775 RepID=A0A5C3M9T1_9AGAR|nr:hypothetical protein BDQ12DRAFT_677736 [Crucibulum laeve]
MRKSSWFIISHRAHPYHNDTTESIVANSSWSHIQSSLHKMAAAFGEVLNEVLRASCSSIRLDVEQQELAILSLEYRFYCRNLCHSSIRKPVTMFKQRVARKNPSTCNMWLQFGSDWELSAPSFFQIQTALRKIFPSSSQSNRPFTFIIASTPNLLLPPLSTWTIAILRSSPVTVLKLLDIANGVHGCIWKMIFPTIIKAASTSIKELYVDKCRLIPPDQILRLLHKLPELRSLTLGRCSSLLNNFSTIPPKRLSLSNLHTLCAPLDWIFRFTFGERALPSLRKLVIYPRDSQSASINDEAISTALPALFAKLNEDKTYPKISFTMGPTAGDHIFTFTAPVIPASMDMQLTKEEEGHFNQPMEYPESDMLAAFAWRLQYRCSTKAMNLVTELSIRMSSAEESSWSVDYLTRWITMFTWRELLKHLGNSLNHLPSIIIDNVLYD